MFFCRDYLVSFSIGMVQVRLTKRISVKNFMKAKGPRKIRKTRINRSLQYVVRFALLSNDLQVLLFYCNIKMNICFQSLKNFQDGINNGTLRFVF